MNKELVEKFKHYLWYECCIGYLAPEAVLKWFEQEGYEIIKKDELTKEELVCPFCGEDNFDEVGLKDHLINYCDKYSKTEDLSSGRMFR